MSTAEIGLSNTNTSRLEPGIISSLTKYTPHALITALVLAYGMRLLAPPTLWLDEAMLYVNIRDITWNEIFTPLPFYDQTTPVAYITLLKLIHSIFGLNEALLRLPSWLALVACLALIAHLPDTNRPTRIFAAAMLAGGFVTARIVTDVKPYMLEAMFTLAMMITFHPTTTGPWSKAPRRIALLICAMLATTAFPLVAFAVGVPAILFAARTDFLEQRRFRHWQSLQLALIFAATLLLYIIYFIGYLAPGLKLLAANHAYAFGPVGFLHGRTLYAIWIEQRLLNIFASHWHGHQLLLLLAAFVGMYMLVRARKSYYPAQFATLLAFIVAANVTGYFPIMEERFSVFMLPWLVLFCGTGLGLAIRPFHAALMQAFTVSALTAAILSTAASPITDPFHQQARQSIAFIQDNPQLPLVTTVTGQPVVDAYLTSMGPADRLACTVDAAQATTNRCTKPKAPEDGAFNGSATKWYLMNYLDVATWRKVKYGFPGRSIEEPLTAYFDWIMQNLRRDSRPRLLFNLGSEQVAARISANLKPGEKLTLIIDERPPSPTLGHGAAKLYRFDPAPALGR